MHNSSSSEVALPDPAVTARSSIGADSRPLRFLIVTLVVAFYIALGFWLHPTTAEYTLLGVPILLAFQWGIQRQPLLTLWVRAGPPLRLDAWFCVLWFLFSLVPAYDLLIAARGMDWGSAATAGAAIVGAFGLAYALRALRGTSGWQTALYFLAAGIVGLLPLIPSLLLPQVLHMRINGQVAAAQLPPLLTILQVGIPRFLLGPVGFVVEEVFFRGGLDTYLHRGEKGIGWVSAIYIAALWGLWHLPGQTIPGGQFFSTVVGLLVSQVIIGVPLSLLWRKTGNLAVPDTTHAVLEAVRSIMGATL